MARPLRIEFPGAFYHLTARGNARQAIVGDNADRSSFLEVLAEVVSRFAWRCPAYCLMDNHYHLLVETLRPNLAVGMRQLNGLYAQRFNRRHRRVGHLFQGRYHAVLVEQERHLLELSRYVVLNPVRAGACARPEQWRWSSYSATAGLARCPSFLAVDWLLGQFGGERRQAQARYRAFVAGGVGEDAWAGLLGDLYLGSERFVHGAAELAVPTSEVPRPQWQPLRVPLEQIFATRGSAAITVAYRDYGYRLREIAEHLGVHYATVSRRLRALEQRAAPLPSQL